MPHLRTRAGWLLGLVAVLMSPAAVRGDVDLVQLEAVHLPLVHPQWRELGMRPGDVLIRNDFVGCVVFTAERQEKGAPLGRGLILAGLAGTDPPLAIDPCDQMPRAGVSVSRLASSAVVRVSLADEGWSGAIRYLIHANLPWIEIQTTVRNGDKERVLEVPIVDALWPARRSKVGTDGAGIVYLTAGERGSSFAYVPQDAKFRLEEEDDAWLAGFISGDPQPKLLERVRHRLVLFGRSQHEIMQPLTPAKHWPRRLRDRESWYRIEPGNERHVIRRVLASANLADVQTVAQRARESGAAATGAPLAPRNRIVGRMRTPPSTPRTPGLQRKTLPATEGATASAPARPMPSHKRASPSTEGPLPRPQARSFSSNELILPAERTSTPSKAETSTTTRPNFPSPEQPKGTSATKPAASRPRSANGAPITLPKSILEIEHLPPPIDGAGDEP